MHFPAFLRTVGLENKKEKYHPAFFNVCSPETPPPDKNVEDNSWLGYGGCTKGVTLLTHCSHRHKRTCVCVLHGPSSNKFLLFPVTFSSRHHRKTLMKCVACQLQMPNAENIAKDLTEEMHGRSSVLLNGGMMVAESEIQDYRTGKLLSIRVPLQDGRCRMTQKKGLLICLIQDLFLSTSNGTGLFDN